MELTTDWTTLHEFKSVILTDSFVLSWFLDRGSLFVDIDLVLAPEHPLYEPPRPSQSQCIHAAHLEFPSCGFLSRGDDDRGAGDVDKNIGDMGLGKISGFRKTGEGLYELEGSFGIVKIRADRPILRLNALDQ